MNKQNAFDGLLKDLFRHDRPTLLRQITRVAIKRFLNVEVTKILERRSDIIVHLSNGTILHIELQSFVDSKMTSRMGIYWFLIKDTFGLPLRQVVLYLGQRRWRTPARVDEDEMHFGFTVMDIRQVDAEALMATGNAGDLALAVLAGGGHRQIPAILRKAASRKGLERERLLAQILVLSGLRGVSVVQEVESKLKSMGVVIDVTKNPVLMKWRREALAEGKAEGRAEGVVEGKVEERVRVLSELLEHRFGHLPKWAQDRLAQASLAQLQRWTTKAFTAETLEGVIRR